MLIERIKTSLILPKIIFGATVILFAFAIAMGYVVVSFALSGSFSEITESIGISDMIRAEVISNEG